MKNVVIVATLMLKSIYLKKNTNTAENDVEELVEWAKAAEKLTELTEHTTAQTTVL